MGGGSEGGAGGRGGDKGKGGDFGDGDSGEKETGVVELRVVGQVPGQATGFRESGLVLKVKGQRFTHVRKGLLNGVAKGVAAGDVGRKGAVVFFAFFNNDEIRVWVHEERRIKEISEFGISDLRFEI